MKILKTIKWCLFGLFIMFFLGLQAQDSPKKKTDDKKPIYKSKEILQFEKPIIVKPVILTPNPVETPEEQEPVEKVLIEINLNYFAVSETTRNRIDNGDCKRVFGRIIPILYELDENNEMVHQYETYGNKEALFEQSNFESPPPIALSYYQDNRSNASNDVINSITYNIPLSKLNDGKVMLILETEIGTRHKDNDFATYDLLYMKNTNVSRFLLKDVNSQQFTVKVNTDENYSERDYHFLDDIIPMHKLIETDDTHFIWVQVTCNKK